MKNARVTVDGSKSSMATLIAMVNPEIATQKDAYFMISPSCFLAIDSGFSDIYPRSKELRYKIAQKAETSFIGVWQQIPIYYSRTPKRWQQVT